MTRARRDEVSLPSTTCFLILLYRRGSETETKALNGSRPSNSTILRSLQWCEVSRSPFAGSTSQASPSRTSPLCSETGCSVGEFDRDPSIEWDISGTDSLVPIRGILRSAEDDDDLIMMSVSRWKVRARHAYRTASKQAPFTIQFKIMTTVIALHDRILALLHSLLSKHQS